MLTLIDKINQIKFPGKGYELLDVLDTLYKIVSNNLAENEKVMLRHDLDHYYHEKGRWLVHKTFAGGIIFLREPEVINKIEIRFYSDPNEAAATVEYASEKRNARNVKYKPTAGQIESITWSMGHIFPNFNKYSKDIKVILMAIIGKIIKHICESYRKDSWFMQFEKPFEIELFLDGERELIYKVEVD
ncbi:MULTISPECIES: hypothetical protein [Niastella]|uniref:Uncharacterized protein n=1 Tax=Niastella soli TaxID=2821487 RepID=A0ABS3YYW1_9BACT|nr:hypothetical protein [Niastella soli]MBO9203108.1 hypothetical protein [Niastella soli]